MTKNILMILFVSSLVIFLSGCINIDGEQTINEEGFSQVELKLDVSQLMEMSNQMGEGSQDTENPCESYDNEYNKTQTEIDFSMQCNYDEKGIITLSGSKQLNENDNLIIEKSLFKTTYTYNPKKIIETQLNMLDQEDSDMSSEGILEEGKQYGIELVYTLQMPGIIVDSDTIGIVSEENKIEYDLYEVDSLDELEVISEVENTNMKYIVYGGVGLGVLILSIIVIIFIIKISKVKKQVSNSNNNNNNAKQSFQPGQNVLSQNEQMAKNYIENYKSSYSRESIKQGLLQANIPENEIESYLIKYF
jgi:hypothetical protein